MEIHVREAAPEDRNTLVEFNAAMALETEHKRLENELLSRGVLEALRNPARGRYFVADVERRTVGQLLVTYEWSDWRCADFWWIQSVYVAPDARRRGVFGALYRFTEGAAKKAGACGLRLYVERENKRAQDTYRALGMTHSHYDLFECEFRSSAAGTGSH